MQPVLRGWILPLAPALVLLGCASCTLAPSAPPGLSGGGEAPGEGGAGPVLTVELADGSRLLGEAGRESLPVEATYARLEIPLRDLRGIVLAGEREPAEIEMRNGDRIKGALLVNRLELKTAFGEVSVPMGRVVRIRGRGEGAGGTVTTRGGWVIHAFTNVGASAFAVSGGALRCDVLVVAGGGAGGAGYGGGGGGGGGGFIRTNMVVRSGTTAVMVGRGGLGKGGSAGDCGAASLFGGVTALGGGGGGYKSDGRGGKGACGSGGGAGPGATGDHHVAGCGTAGQGHHGGETTTWHGGGGGGAGARGEPATVAGGGNGGDGLPCAVSGTTTCYAGGGGGGQSSSYGGLPGIAGAGGQGGGGSASAKWSTPGHPGMPATGGGGGGGSDQHVAGGSGGSGIVIVRYRQ